MQLFTSFKEKILDSKAFVQKHQRFIPVIAFISGFTWDNVTITRIDALSDNMIIFLYLVLLGLLIIVSQFHNQDRLKSKLLIKYSHWFPAGMQFFMGGLFSVYVVFYFKSASFTKASLFLIILVILFIANEFLEKKLNNTYLLFSLYFLAAFSFFIFFIPMITGVMNAFTFILGSLCGLALPVLIIYFLYKKKIFTSFGLFRRHLQLIIGIFLFLNLFYWFNWIPPVPLAMKYTGIYHHASKNQAENIYTLKYEKPNWYQFFTDDDSDFYYQQGDSAFCFASVFAPTRLTEKIAHKWQYYSEQKDEWLTTDNTVYQLTGGRDGGYRGYTFKKNVQTGRWRIDIITEDDLILGRIYFKVMPRENPDREFVIIEK
jgi:hypothetical protein